MSLFFLIVTAVMYSLCHWIARFTKPGTDYIIEKDFIFTGNKKILIKNIKDWVKESSSLLFIHENGDEFVINKNASFLSYGYFYHIKIVPIESDTLFSVKFKVEAKLISTANKSHFFSKNWLQLLELEEDKRENKAA